MHKMYKLDNNEFCFSDGPGNFEILRVPGGWVYTKMRLDCGQMSSVFVPFDNEFQTIPPKSEQGDSKNSVRHLQTEISALSNAVFAINGKTCEDNENIRTIAQAMRDLSAVQ